MAINSIWNNNSPMDYLGFLSTDPDNNTEDNEWLTHFQQLVQEKLSEMNEDKDSAATVNPAEEIAKWKENIYNKMKNGETEESFQIGGQSFSMKEWDKLLDSFDKAEEALQEAIEEEEEVKDKEMAETAKKSIVNDTPAQPLIDMLLSDTLKVTFPTDATNESDEDAEDVFYMVALDEKGIRCIKNGSDTYEWEIEFEDDSQYEAARDFLGWVQAFDFHSPVCICYQTKTVQGICWTSPWSVGICPSSEVSGTSSRLRGPCRSPPCLPEPVR